MLGSEGDSTQSRRVKAAIEFQSQPFFVAEPWTARPGTFVSLERALVGYSAIVKGAADSFSEGALMYAGALPFDPRQ